jgi:hypothetical protein
MREATHWHKTVVDGKSIWWIDGTERNTRCVAAITEDEDLTAPRGLICYGYTKWDRPTFEDFRSRAASGVGGGYFGLYAHLIEAVEQQRGITG